MDFSVDAASRTPIYRQLAEQIRSAIARGRLQPNARLPSVRDLSRRLVINPNTVARVYTELERDGLLTTRHGLGVFVAPYGSDLTKKARRERLVALLDGFFTEAVLLGFTADEVRELVNERIAQFQWQAGV
ncbi:GntR family transcriptional regulator [Schlesneria paludicola]|uniref:GntR family transcriptional regulator n=1 Tax=Schlesneria paludicola TaxID=360056 RepID=UPI00029B22B4|nr:GntR family transcriptional regulator [Schlesneria paludicola]